MRYPRVLRLGAGILLIAAMLALFTMLACAKPSPSPTPKPSPTATAIAAPAPKPAVSPSAGQAAWPPAGAKLQKDVIAVAKLAGGTSYAMTVGFMNVYNKYTKDSHMATQILASPKATAEAFVAGKVDISQGSTSYHLPQYDGTEGTKARLRTLWAGSTKVVSYNGFMVLADSKIKTFADLKGKRVGAEVGGSNWSRDITLGLLSANGMTKNDIKWIVVASAEEGSRDLLEGRLDAYVYNLGSAQREIAESPHGLYLLPVTDREIAGIQKEDPTIIKVTVPKGYIGIKNEGPVTFPGIPVSWFIRADVDEYTAYHLVKIMTDYADELKKVHPNWGAFVGVKEAMDQPKLYMPYHPGAVRFFQEQGVWGSAQTKLQKEALDTELNLYGDISDLAKMKALGVSG